MRPVVGVVVVLALAMLGAVPAHAAAGSSGVAALQVALRAHGAYAGPVDGLKGPQTTQAVRVVQRRAGLAADGVVDPQTRAALGKLGAPRLGQRIVSTGMAGWDVAALQFLLARHGFPSGAFTGVFTTRTESALRRFQTWAGIGADGRAGPATVAALRQAPPSCPIALAHRSPSPAATASARAATASTRGSTSRRRPEHRWSPPREAASRTPAGRRAAGAAWW